MGSIPGAPETFHARERSFGGQQGPSIAIDTDYDARGQASDEGCLPREMVAFDDVCQATLVHAGVDGGAVGTVAKLHG